MLNRAFILILLVISVFMLHVHAQEHTDANSASTQSIHADAQNLIDIAKDKTKEASERRDALLDLQYDVEPDSIRYFWDDLVLLSKDEQSLVTVQSMRVLREIVTPELEPAFDQVIYGALESKNFDIRAQAMYMLTYNNARFFDHWPHIRKMLEHDHNDTANQMVIILIQEAYDHHAAMLPRLIDDITENKHQRRSWFSLQVIIAMDRKLTDPHIDTYLKWGKSQSKWVQARAFLLISRHPEKAISMESLTREALADPNFPHRANAMRVLHAIGKQLSDQSIPVLINSLKDRSDVVRELAALTLSQLGPRATDAVPALMEAMKDKNKRVWHASIRALGRIGEPALPAVPALIQSLADNRGYSRHPASMAITRIGPKSHPEVIKAMSTDNTGLRWYLKFVIIRGIKLDPELLPKVKAALKSENTNTQITALEVLAELKPDQIKSSIPDVIKIRAMNQFRTRELALDVIIKMDGQSPEVLPMLLDYVSRPHIRFQSRARSALNQYPQATGSLLRIFLESTNKKVRYQAISTLASMKNYDPEIEIIAPMHDTLESKIVEERIYATLILSRHPEKAKASLPRIIELSTDEDRFMRRATVISMYRIAPNDPAHISIFIKALSDPAVNVRLHALKAMKKLDDIPDKAIPKIADNMKNPKEDDLFISAAEILGNLGSRAESQMPLLLKLYGNRSYYIDHRNHFIDAAAKIDPDNEQLLKTLLVAIGHSNLQRGPYAEKVFIRLGKHAVPALLERLNEDKPKHAWIVIRILGDIGADAEPALPVIQRYTVHENKLIRENAIKAMQSIQESLNLPAVD